ncbi:unnamed protein product [Rhizopus stolonifer]
MNLTVKSKERIVEKFVFEIRSVLSQLNVPLNDIYLAESSCTLANVEQHLRACLLKLNAFQFTHTPEDFSFYLSVETLEGGRPLNNMDWVPFNMNHSYKHIIPIKSTSVDLFQLNTFIMEASKKGKERE